MMEGGGRVELLRLGWDGRTTTRTMSILTRSDGILARRHGDARLPSKPKRMIFTSGGNTFFGEK